MLFLSLPWWMRRSVCVLAGHRMGPWLFVDPRDTSEEFVMDDHVRRCERCRHVEYRPALRGGFAQGPF